MATLPLILWRLSVCGQSCRRSSGIKSPNSDWRNSFCLVQNLTSVICWLLRWLGDFCVAPAESAAIFHLKVIIFNSASHHRLIWVGEDLTCCCYWSHCNQSLKNKRAPVVSDWQPVAHFLSIIRFYSSNKQYPLLVGKSIHCQKNK